MYDVHIYYPKSSHELREAVNTLWPEILRKERPWSGVFWCWFGATVGAVLATCLAVTLRFFMPAVLGAFIGALAGFPGSVRGRLVRRGWRWLAVGMALYGYMLFAAMTTYIITDGWRIEYQITMYVRGASGAGFKLNHLGLTGYGDVIAILCTTFAAYFCSIYRPDRIELIQRARAMDDQKNRDGSSSNV